MAPYHCDWSPVLLAPRLQHQCPLFFESSNDPEIQICQDNIVSMLVLTCSSNKLYQFLPIWWDHYKKRIHRLQCKTSCLSMTTCSHSQSSVLLLRNMQVAAFCMSHKMNSSVSQQFVAKNMEESTSRCTRFLFPSTIRLKPISKAANFGCGHKCHGKILIKLWKNTWLQSFQIVKWLQWFLTWPSYFYALTAIALSLIKMETQKMPPTMPMLAKSFCCCCCCFCQQIYALIHYQDPCYCQKSTN